MTCISASTILNADLIILYYRAHACHFLLANRDDDILVLGGSVAQKCSGQWDCPRGLPSFRPIASLCIIAFGLRQWA